MATVLEDIGLHPVDRQRPAETWSSHQLDNMLIFCLLDRAMDYAQVCRAYNMLESQGLTSRGQIRAHVAAFGEDTVAKRIWVVLKEAGHRFPNPTAEFIVLFGLSDVNLKTISRNLLVRNVKGIGMKLASMFLRNTRGEEYLVMDVHMKRWLAEHGCPMDTTYEERERWFRDYCVRHGFGIYELDMAIWNERRR